MLVTLASCERESTPETKAPPTPPKLETLVFPTQLRVVDEAVNDFVTIAMNLCSSGDYESFRLLWSVEHDPITRQQFESAWQAVTRIRILALERDPINDTYAILAHVALDAKRFPAGHRLRENPQRNVALLILQEQGEWRLTRAPIAVRNYLIELIAPPGKVETLSGESEGVAMDEPAAFSSSTKSGSKNIEKNVTP